MGVSQLRGDTRLSQLVREDWEHWGNPTRRELNSFTAEVEDGHLHKQNSCACLVLLAKQEIIIIKK